MHLICHKTSVEVRAILQDDPQQFHDSPQKLKLDWGGDPVYFRFLQESSKRYLPFLVECDDKIQLLIQYEPLLDMFMVVDDKKLKGYVNEHAKMKFLLSC